MKGIICALLSFCMLWAGRPVLAGGRDLLSRAKGDGEAEAPVYLLWDIPFGSTWEELLDALPGKAQVSPEQIREGDGKLTVEPAGEAVLFGRRSVMDFELDEAGGLSCIWVRFAGNDGLQFSRMLIDKDMVKEAAEEFLMECSAFHQDVLAAFGLPQGGLLQVQESYGGEALAYDYPGGAEGPDTELVLEALLEGREAYLTLITRYGNVFEELQLQRAVGGGLLMRWYIWFFPEPGAASRRMAGLSGLPQPNGFSNDQGPYGE